MQNDYSLFLHKYVKVSFVSGWLCRGWIIKLNDRGFFLTSEETTSFIAFYTVRQITIIPAPDNFPEPCEEVDGD